MPSKGGRAIAAAVSALLASPLAAFPAHAADGVLVFAAASLRNALDAVAADCEKLIGEPVTISYAGSPALARQIEQGAPAEIFISADLDWMAWLSERKLTRKETEVPLLGNGLVMIAPADSPAEARIAPGFDIESLLGGGRLAMANTEAVPAGRYGKAALQRLGVWSAVQGRVAEAENVRAALALVSSGEAPLGIVYRTDAAADPRVKVVAAFPEDSHPPIVYPAAEIAGPGDPAAGAFMKCLRSAGAAEKFEAEGFSVLVPPVSN